MMTRREGTGRGSNGGARALRRLRRCREEIELRQGRLLSDAIQEDLKCGAPLLLSPESEENPSSDLWHQPTNPDVLKIVACAKTRQN
ncbi:hypothetical protein D3C87_1645520 [compost metagenome]